MTKKTYKTHLVGALEKATTVEAYLKETLRYSGRNIQKLTRLKGIFVNRKPAYLKRNLKENDVLRVLELTDSDYGAAPEPGKLDILYEDESVIVLDKPPFKLVHPAGNTASGTLANHLAHYFQQNNLLCTIRPLHRLDRDTSGCVVFAKTSGAQAHLADQLARGELKRVYLAAAEGKLQPPEGEIRLPIAKDPGAPNRRIIRADGDRAVTRYETLSQAQSISLLKLVLETGRTHQIRVHLAGVGHPVVGDKMYGARSPRINRQALHAAEVSFNHPKTNERVVVAAPLPSDIASLVSEIKA